MKTNAIPVHLFMKSSEPQPHGEGMTFSITIPIPQMGKLRHGEVIHTHKVMELVSTELDKKSGSSFTTKLPMRA